MLSVKVVRRVEKCATRLYAPLAYNVRYLEKSDAFTDLDNSTDLYIEKVPNVTGGIGR